MLSRRILFARWRAVGLGVTLAGQGSSTPINAVAAPASARFLPPTIALPEVGESKPAIKLSREDLPEPDAPSNATNSPEGMFSETPSTARIVELPMW